MAEINVADLVSSIMGQQVEQIDTRKEELEKEHEINQNLVTAAGELVLRQSEIDKDKSMLPSTVKGFTVAGAGGDVAIKETAALNSELFAEQRRQLQEAAAAREKYEAQRAEGTNLMDFVRKAFGGDTRAELAYKEYNNEMFDVNNVNREINVLRDSFGNVLTTAKNAAAVDERIISAEEEIVRQQYFLDTDKARLNITSKQATLNQQLNANLAQLDEAKLNKHKELITTQATLVSQEEQRRIQKLSREQLTTGRIDTAATKRVNAASINVDNAVKAVQTLEEYAAVEGGAASYIPIFQLAAKNYADVTLQRALLETELVDSNLDDKTRADKQGKLAELKAAELKARTEFNTTKAEMDDKLASAMQTKIKADTELQLKTVAKYNAAADIFGWAPVDSFRQLEPVMKDKKFTSFITKFDPAKPVSMLKGYSFGEVLANSEKFTELTGVGTGVLNNPALNKLSQAFAEFSPAYIEEAQMVGYTAKQAADGAILQSDGAMLKASMDALNPENNIPGFSKLFKMTPQDFLVLGDANPLAAEYGSYLQSLGENANKDNLKTYFTQKTRDLWHAEIEAGNKTPKSEVIVNKVAKNFSDLLTVVYGSKVAPMQEVVESIPVNLRVSGRKVGLTTGEPAKIYDLTNPNDLIKYVVEAGELSWMDSLLGKDFILKHSQGKMTAIPFVD